MSTVFYMVFFSYRSHLLPLTAFVMLQVERQPKLIADSPGGPGPPVHLDRKLSLARNPLAVGLPARRRTERGSDSRLANRTAFCSVLVAHSSAIAARRRFDFIVCFLGCQRYASECFYSEECI